MAAPDPATTAVMTSPSFVIVADAAEFMPKFILGAGVLIIGTMAFVGLMVFMSAVLPRLRERTSATLSNRPWQSLGLGIVGSAVLGSVAALIISNSSVEYLLKTEWNYPLLSVGISIIALMVLMTFIGATGLIQTIGDKLENLNGQSMPGLRKTFWGSLTLVGASLFPAIGWFIIVPASLLYAFGATLRTLLPGGK